MAEFDQPMPDYQLVTTHFGDTLQDVANRELGDENRWIELVWLNDLLYPYLTDDSSQVTANVLLNGSLIRVPSTAGLNAVTRDQSEPGQVYERDMKMENRRLVLDNEGDIAVVAGVANLKQQLQHRFDTPKGQLRRHPEYGCRIHELRGKVNGPLAAHLAREYVKTAINAEYRISRIVALSASSEGDVIQAVATGEAIAGDSIDLSVRA